MKSRLPAVLLLALASTVILPAEPPQERGKAAEAGACLACHGLKIIHAQRLSKAAWGRELDKMERWGAMIADREALLEYLAESFGPDRPPAVPQLTGDGSETAAGAKTTTSKTK